MASSGRLSNFSKFSGKVAGGGAWDSIFFSAGGAVVPAVLSLLGRSAESPLPSALRWFRSGSFVMGQDFLCELNVSFRAAGSWIVREDRLSEAGSFCGTNITGDNGLKNLVSEERS